MAPTSTVLGLFFWETTDLISNQCNFLDSMKLVELVVLMLRIIKQLPKFQKLKKKCDTLLHILGIFWDGKNWKFLRCPRLPKWKIFGRHRQKNFATHFAFSSFFSENKIIKKIVMPFAYNVICRTLPETFWKVKPLKITITPTFSSIRRHSKIRLFLPAYHLSEVNSRRIRQYANLDKIRLLTFHCWK